MLGVILQPNPIVNVPNRNLEFRFVDHIHSPKILARHVAELEFELRLLKIAAAEGLDLTVHILPE